jgi:hypothetical protein
VTRWWQRESERPSKASTQCIIRRILPLVLYTVDLTPLFCTISGIVQMYTT